MGGARVDNVRGKGVGDVQRSIVLSPLTHMSITYLPPLIEKEVVFIFTDNALYSVAAVF